MFVLGGEWYRISRDISSLIGSFFVSCKAIVDLRYNFNYFIVPNLHTEFNIPDPGNIQERAILEHYIL